MPCPVGFSTMRSGRGPQCRPPMGLASRDQGARRKSMFGIVDDEQRRDRPRPPSARKVAAPWPRLRRCRSSKMKDIAVVTAPRIRGHGARNGRYWGPRPDLAGRGARTRQYVTARLRRLCLTATSAWPMGSPGGEPSATLRCCRRGEHPEPRKHRWVRCIGGRSWRLVRNAG